MAKAIWNETIIAESESYESVEGNVYFPPDALKTDYFKPSAHQTTCGWKGVASYYTISVDGVENPNAAWYYAEPKEAAKNIKGYVAFWKGVQVEK